jgi:hypothetical protein
MKATETVKVVLSYLFMLLSIGTAMWLVFRFVLPEVIRQMQAL